MHSLGLVKSLRADINKRLGIPNEDMVFKAVQNNGIDTITTFLRSNSGKKLRFIVYPDKDYCQVLIGKTSKKCSYDELMDNIIKVYQS